MEKEQLGLLLAALAGLTTTVGGLFVFAVSRIKVLPLAISMAIAAGVMFFLSFVELFATSLNYFEDALAKGPHNLEKVPQERADSSLAFLYTSLLFFGGWLLVSLLNKVVHIVLGCSNCSFCLGANAHSLAAEGQEVKEIKGPKVMRKVRIGKSAALQQPSEIESSTNRVIPVESQLYSTNNSSSDETTDSELIDERRRPHVQNTEGSFLKQPASKEGVVAKWLRRCMLKPPRTDKDLEAERQAQEELVASYSTISHVSIFTAIALILHNLPEGVATYIAILDSVPMGIGIAVAIAVHNIPEGIAVAVPIYYGTGSRWKAFLFSLIAGLAEPLGALIGYLTLTRHSSLLVLAVLMALVAGCMANLSVQQLYPLAIRYDPTDRVVSLCTFLSMFVMAMSLVGFKLSGL